MREKRLHDFPWKYLVAAVPTKKNGTIRPFSLFWTKEKHKAGLAWIATEQLAATGTAFTSQQTAAICLIKVTLRLNIYNTQH